MAADRNQRTMNTAERGFKKREAAEQSPMIGQDFFAVKNNCHGRTRPAKGEFCNSQGRQRREQSTSRTPEKRKRAWNLEPVADCNRSIVSNIGGAVVAAMGMRHNFKMRCNLRPSHD